MRGVLLVGFATWALGCAHTAPVDKTDTPESDRGKDESERSTKAEPRDEPLSEYLENVTQISTGPSHACAVHRGGYVTCWGNNDTGQVGVPVAQNPEGNNFSRPVVVPGLPRMKEVAAGSLHTCAVAEDGGIWCWGSTGLTDEHFKGGMTGSIALPKGPETARAGIPEPIASPDGALLTGARTITLEFGGSRACAGFADGVRCWNTYGSVGGESGAGAARVDLAQVGLMSDVISVAVSHGIVCAVSREVGRRRLQCWPVDKSPQRVKWPKKADEPVAVRMGQRYASAWDATGELYTWKITVKPKWWNKKPTHVTWPDKSPTLEASVGDSSVCAVGQDGQVHCFLSDEGGLGEQEKALSWARADVGPHPIAGIEKAMSLAVGGTRNAFGYGYGCALRETPAPSGAQVFCWGDNEFGQLGNGTFEGSKKGTEALGAIRRAP